jgi:hypothetical protein
MIDKFEKELKKMSIFKLLALSFMNPFIALFGLKRPIKPSLPVFDKL